MEVSAEVDAGGYFSEVAAADERGAETSEFALARVWEAVEESVGDDQPEDGVSDEFELLVVGGGVGEGFGLGFVGERTVSKCPGEKFGTQEGVVEDGQVGLIRLCSTVFFMARR